VSTGNRVIEIDVGVVRLWFVVGGFQGNPFLGVIQVIVTHEDNKEEREKGMTVMVRTLLSRVRTFPAKLGAHVS